VSIARSRLPGRRPQLTGWRADGLSRRRPANGVEAALARVAAASIEAPASAGGRAQAPGPDTLCRDVPGAGPGQPSPGHPTTMTGMVQSEARLAPFRGLDSVTARRGRRRSRLPDVRPGIAHPGVGNEEKPGRPLRGGRAFRVGRPYHRNEAIASLGDRSDATVLSPLTRGLTSITQPARGSASTASTPPPPTAGGRRGGGCSPPWWGPARRPATVPEFVLPLLSDAKPFGGVLNPHPALPPRL
jgi:hypothetical protein